MRFARAAIAIGALAGLPVLGEDILKLPVGDPARKDRDVPLVLDAITDTSRGDLLTPVELPKRIADVRLLLIGEEHTGMAAHRVERRVIEVLHRAGRKVLVGLEMYPYTAQKSLDDWSGGKLAEDDFLEVSHWYKNWGYNWAYYRDIFLFARENRLRMLAVNAPREVVSAVRKKGFQGLTAEEAAHIPTRIDAENADHLRLFKASFDEESFHAAQNDAEWQAMLNAQCTWDATMAYNAVESLGKEDDPRTIMVVLVGTGHVQYGLGIERQARQWFQGKVASLISVPVAEEKKGPIDSVRASYANFLWGIPYETDPLYPDLGISTRPLEGEPRLEIIHVEKKSPAERAGLRVKDVLLAMDEDPIPDREALARRLAGKNWGDTAAFEIRRDKDAVSVTVIFRRERVAEARTKP